MTAKTILVQLHHKVQTFERINKHIVLAVQDVFMEYVQREFSFGHIQQANSRDPMQIHTYRLDQENLMAPFCCSYHRVTAPMPTALPKRLGCR